MTDSIVMVLYIFSLDIQVKLSDFKRVIVQLVERLVWDQEVVRSCLAYPTKYRSVDKR